MNRHLEVYVGKETIEQASGKTLNFLKKVLLDVTAFTIAGSQAEEAVGIKDFAMQLWKKGDCSLFISSEKLNAVGAAFVNASMASVFFKDYCQLLEKNDLGTMLFPALLAAAEDREVSGKEFLTSLLISYEIGLRVEKCAHQLNIDKKMDKYTWGVIGTAAGVARVLKLEGNSIEHALGLAERYSSYAPMIDSADGALSDEDRVSWGSMTGVNSAYLAEKGISSTSTLLSSGKEESFIKGLGEHYHVETINQNTPYMTESEREKKFLLLTESGIGKEKSKQLFEMINQIERIQNIRTLTSLINKDLLKQVV
ncbi:MmgE/PrpD family protein [Alkalihalobacillus sp. BA299]|uniref:MmgE/PrpD family protein n=1 Tax=Alkalihalobacillus sp. BA299 TaxID=2815938 RepID=UPI001ADA885C|nr:MmgE/PrpD family protein [Alkalihalobacillus sp. BA299]